MIKPREKVGYFDKEEKDFREVVLLEMLTLLSKKSNIQLVKLKSKVGPHFPDKKVDRVAVSSSIDTESRLVVKEIISGDSLKLKEYLPVKKKIIKPLYSFLDEEILLFAKLKDLKYYPKKQEPNKLNDFIDDFEKNHPEVKRAIINSLLKI